MSAGSLSSQTQLSSPSDMTEAKAALFSRFDELRKWREGQVQHMRAEQQKQIQQLQEDQKRVGALMDQRRENIKHAASENVSNTSMHDYRNASQASLRTTVSGSSPEVESSALPVSHHLPYPRHAEAADDTPINPGISGNVNSFEDLIEQQIQSQQTETVSTNRSVPGDKSKPKRPFLKKGSGLRRFMCRPVSYPKSTPFNKTEAKPFSVQPKPSLPLTSNLKLISRKNADVGKTVHFNVSEQQDFSEASFRPLQSSPKAGTSRSKHVSNIPEPKSDESGDSLKEHQELLVFEALERVTHNSSFNSDSSVVQKLLKCEPFQPSDVVRLRNKATSTAVPNQRLEKGDKVSAVGEKLPENFAQTANLHEILELVKSRTQLLEQKLKVNPRLMSLENEPLVFSNTTGSDLPEPTDITIDDVISVSSGEDEELKQDENGSTGHAYLQNAAANSSSASSDEDTNFQDLLRFHSSPLSKKKFDAPVLDNHSRSPSPLSHPLDEKEGLDPEVEKIMAEHGDIENFEMQTTRLTEDPTITSGRLKLQEKVQELEQEIEIFHAQNAELKSLKKQREEALEKLRKERKEFEEYQSSMRNKMEKEFAEEKRQFQRQKQTFERYQKLGKDLPGRKEREEITLLRQEVSKLQEDMKKHEIKWSSEFRRLRLQLTNVEKERDSLKVENQRLEEQRLDLLALLKENKKKAVSEQPTNVPVKFAAASLKASQMDAKEKVPFSETSRVPREESTGLKGPNVNSVIHGLLSHRSIDSLDTDEDRFGDSDHEDSPPSAPVPQKHHVRFNLQPQVYQREGNNAEPEFKETHYRDRVERIYKTGEIDTVFQNGSRKHTSADGLNTIFYYYNGDTKEVFPDKRIVYKYADGGTVQIIYPDGLEVIEYSNGQVERCYPDGMKHITFADGTQHIRSPDGSEEIQIPEGTVVKLSADGTETIQFANGEKEIKTADYVRHEYLDGTVKTVYKSGRQETRYASGRIRIKDRHGNVIVDTKHFGTELAVSTGVNRKKVYELIKENRRITQRTIAAPVRLQDS